MSRLLVSIVNWNTRDELRRCLRSLAEAAVAGAEIVVVDNASGDGSADMVAAEFPSVRLIRSERNLGFAGGNNLALAGADATHVLVLNPDVEVTRDAVDGMADFLDRNPGVAAVAPVLVDDDGKAQSHLYRRFPTLAQIALFWTLFGPIARRVAPLRRRIFEHDLRSTRPIAVDQLPGAGMLIRGDALRAVGPLDAGFFVWWEDVDWCYRARRDGFSLFVLPAARCRHAGGASFATWDVGTRVFQFYRAFYRFLAKHHLDALARRVTPIIRADLALKELLLRIRHAFAQTNVANSTLRDARLAVRDSMAALKHDAMFDFVAASPDTPTLAVKRPREPVPWERTRPQGSYDGPEVDVVVVNWNGRRWLPRCLDTLAHSTLRIRVIVVDNASTDGSAAYVRSEHPDVELIALDHNAGYAGGANVGLRHATARYAFVMNPDVVLAADHLEVLRDRLDVEPRIGVAQGKLYRMTPEEFDAGVEPATVLDSAGHTIRRSRMVVDRGQGELDGPHYAEEASVFSACGAALFVRRTLLDDLSRSGDFFDDSFFAYKEDIDLGWRARVLGWDVRYVPTAFAHHVRALPLGGDAWRALSLPARRHSWKNHYLLLLRNDRLADVLRALPSIAAWEVLRLGHALLRDRGVLSAYRELAQAVPDARRARRELRARRRVDPTEIRQWFGTDAVPVGHATTAALAEIGA